MKTWTLALLLVTISAFAEARKPKYGPQAVPLSQDSSHLRGHDAPDFWALIPFYAAQRDGRACSLASLTMVANAIRKSGSLTADDKLATQERLIDEIRSKTWKANLGIGGKGVTLRELKPLAESVAKKYSGAEVDVHVFQPDLVDDTTLQALRKILSENEKSDRDLIVVNYLQGTVTGDADVGHIAPIGAYDASKKRVLILDPDRDWYEPYWTSDETLLKAMATKDPVSKQNRGLLWIRVNRP